MAVFTTLTPLEVRKELPDFNIGELLSLEPIASGIENTNYFLDTTEGRWVLTVFERLSESQLPFYLELCAAPAEPRMPCGRSGAHEIGPTFFAHQRQALFHRQSSGRPKYRKRNRKRMCKHG